MPCSRQGVLARDLLVLCIIIIIVATTLSITDKVVKNIVNPNKCNNLLLSEIQSNAGTLNSRLLSYNYDSGLLQIKSRVTQVGRYISTETRLCSRKELRDL